MKRTLHFILTTLLLLLFINGNTFAQGFVKMTDVINSSNGITINGITVTSSVVKTFGAKIGSNFGDTSNLGVKVQGRINTLINSDTLKRVIGYKICFSEPIILDSAINIFDIDGSYQAQEFVTSFGYNDDSLVLPTYQIGSKVELDNLIISESVDSGLANNSIMVAKSKSDTSFVNLPFSDNSGDIKISYVGKKVDCIYILQGVLKIDSTNSRKTRSVLLGDLLYSKSFVKLLTKNVDNYSVKYINYLNKINIKLSLVDCHNSKILLMRSKDGINWEKINTFITFDNDFSFSYVDDVDLIKGRVSYYKFIILGEDGKYSTNIKVVNIDKNSDLVIGSTNEGIFVNSPNFKTTSVEVYDISGLLIYSNNMVSNKFRWDMRSKFKGLKIVRLYFENGINYTLKVLLK